MEPQGATTASLGASAINLGITLTSHLGVDGYAVAAVEHPALQGPVFRGFKAIELFKGLGFRVIELRAESWFRV